MERIFVRYEIEMPELSLLALDDIEGENKLEVLEKYGLLAEISDLSLVGKAKVDPKILTKDSSKYCGYVTGSINYDLENPAPYYLSADEKVRCADMMDGVFGTIYCTRLRLKKIPDYILDYIASNKRINDKGVYEVELGKFFLKEVDRVTKNKLNVYADRGKNSNLNIKPKYKLNDIKHFNDSLLPSLFNDNPIYEFEGKDYVRIGNTIRSWRWFEKVPIMWLVDEKTNTLVSKSTFFSVYGFDILEGNYEQYLKKEMFHEMFYIFRRMYYDYVSKMKHMNSFRVRFMSWIEKILNKTGFKELPSTSNAKLLPASSSDLAIIDAKPYLDNSDIKSEEKKEEKIEINNKEINRLCDYIKEKCLLLVPTKSKEVLEKLNQLLDTHEREVKDLDSEMYAKYNLTLMTYEDSILNLWKGLNSLKVEVDSFLKDTNNILNYGEEYVIYLRNCVEKYQGLSYGDLSGGSAINNLANVVKKIDGEYDEIFPYYRDEILKLIFLSIHFLNNINPYAIDNYVSNHKDNIGEHKILDKLIIWFELYFFENKDKLSSELQTKYYNIKMTRNKKNKLSYIFGLAKIIDPTLILEQDKDKKK